MQIVVFNDLIFHTGCFFLGFFSLKSKIRYFVRICFLMCIFLLLALSVCRLGRVFFVWFCFWSFVCDLEWLLLCSSAVYWFWSSTTKVRTDNHGKRLVWCVFRWFFVFLLFYSHKMKNPLNQNWDDARGRWMLLLFLAVCMYCTGLLGVAGQV